MAKQDLAQPSPLKLLERLKIQFGNKAQSIQSYSRPDKPPELLLQPLRISTLPLLLTTIHGCLIRFYTWGLFIAASDLEP